MSKQRMISATTHIDRHHMQLTKGALDDAAEQINAGSRPSLTVEHDITIPPYGKTIKAWVESREDGQHQLVLENEVFDEILFAELPSGRQLLKQESKTDPFPFANPYSNLPDDSFISYDWANFESKEDMRLFIEEIKSESQVEFAPSVFARKSFIPDPEFLIGITATIGKYLIARKVLIKASDRVLELAAEDIARFYAFTKATVASAVKYARPKGRPITYVFVVTGDPTLEFVAYTTDAALVMSSVTPAKLESALSDAGFYYSTLDAARIQYLLSPDGLWEFNYLLTKTGGVIGTEVSFRRRVKRFELLEQQIKSAENASNTAPPTR